MAEEYREGIEELPEDALHPDLRGVVIDVDEARKRQFWIVICIAVLLLGCVAGWAYWYSAKTDEEILQERLNQQMEVVGMLRKVQSLVSSTVMTADGLIEATDLALKVATTPLRHGGNIAAPLIPERHFALIEALEALQRLELEKGLESPSIAKAYGELVKGLGEQRLEYYENGVMEKVPLLETAWVLKLIREERLNVSFVDQREIKELEELLASLETREGSSLAIAAYKLGAWYRYYNDLENAKRCFHIGRRFVEGYENSDGLVRGHRPKDLNLYWEAYVHCIEGLAEMSIQHKHYREARSYLKRIYNTPGTITLLPSAHEFNRVPLEYSQQLESLRHDVEILQTALADPLAIPDFPFFSLSPPNLKLNFLLPQLRQAHDLRGTEFQSTLWDTLSDETQEQIQQPDPLHGDEHQQILSEIITVLNVFVNDPNFYRQVTINEEFLSEYSQKLLKREATHSLSEEEYRFINREIIELALGAAVEPGLILSDGTRLSNRLTGDQVSELLRYTERMAREPNLSSDQRQKLLKESQLLREEKQEATLLYFHERLKQWEIFCRKQVDSAHDDELMQQSLLKELEETIKKLETADTLDLSQLKAVRNQKIQALASQQAAEERSRQYETHLAELSETQKTLTLSLQQQLKQNQQALAFLEENEHLTPSASEDGEEVLLSQLEEQIKLRQQYLELLEGLRATGGERELERLRIERTRLEGVIEALSENIANSSGDEREILESELSEYQASRHELLIEFEGLYGPLRKIVDTIASREEEILAKELQLREAREEIHELIGHAGQPGLLEDKSARLAELLQQKSQESLNIPLYDTEIRRLSKEVATAHGRLNVLLQREAQARTYLATVYPAFFRNEFLFVEEGDLAPLQRYLHRQDELMKKYETLWQVTELYDDICLQERIVLSSLQEISDELTRNREFSQEQTQNLTRHMQGLLTARKRLSHNQHLLKEIAKGQSLQETLREISGKGYLIDSVEMFQLEHEMGLNISAYRQAFDQRAEVLSQLRELSKEREALEKAKIHAARLRDQESIDKLIPQVAEKDNIINLLSQKELEINRQLGVLADEYKKRFHLAERFRQNAQPQMEALRTRIHSLNEEIVHSEREVETLIDDIFSTAEELKTAITSLTVNDLTNLDEIIEVQRSELKRLYGVRDNKKHENYYKSKALFWVGKSFYAQSRLSSFSDLLKSQVLRDDILRDEQRHSSLEFEEFELEAQEEQHKVISQAGSDDGRQAAFQYWIDSLERNALTLFNQDLPRHIPPETLSEDRAKHHHSAQLKDSQIFVARSRFLTGQIHLNRGLRFIRGKRQSQRTPSERAIKELDKAITAFFAVLDFTLPFGIEGTEHTQLSEERTGSQEFPTRSRFPINLDDEAGIYLGIAATLKGEHQQSIKHYRSILTNMVARVAHSTQLITQFPKTINFVDPILLDQASYQWQVHPVYASLLAAIPHAHELFYRLGTSYQALAEEQYRLELENSYLPTQGVLGFKERFQEYSGKAIAYYSQIIHTHAYSPLRRAALMKRALMFKQLGRYQEARQDFISVMGSPEDLGGSLDLKDLTPKGDLPGELNPGYTYVSFELGKLHLENKNYEAAAEAFIQAKEGDPKASVVLQARIAFVDALIQSRDWIMTDLILTELIEEYPLQGEERQQLYPVELWLQAAQVKQQLGNLNAAKEVLSQVFQRAPAALIKDKRLDLGNRYGLLLLEQEYRDSIRPLAEASLASADLALKLHNFDMAKAYYKDAAQLFDKVPWQEDKLMRELRESDYRSYVQEKGLLARWGLLKVDVQEHIHSSFAEFRNQFDTINRSLSQGSESRVLEAKIDEVLGHVSGSSHTFQELIDRIKAFQEAERPQLPETQEKQRIQQKRNLERQMAIPEALRYDALARIRQLLIDIQDDGISLTIEHLKNLFPKESLESQLLNAFALEFSKGLPLTKEDRDHMLPSYSNIENLQAIPNSQDRLSTLNQEFREWTESQMRLSGLDDLFIPVSEQAGILEDSDLTLASLFSHLEDGQSYIELTELVDRYLVEANSTPSRVLRQEGLWQMVELATMTAEYFMDWERVERYTRYLLAAERRQFFLLAASAERFRMELSLARALMHLGQHAYSDLIFIQDESEQLVAERRAQTQLNEAAELLKHLADVEGEETSAVITRIQAKQLLSQMNG